MSYQPIWLRDLVAFSIQAAALVGVGAVMASLLRLRMPRVRHAYWQALLAVCVFLPLLQPWRPEVLEPSGAVLSEMTFAAPAAAAAPTVPSLAEIILFLICAGIVLRLAWMALGLGRLWLYRRHAERINQTPEAVREAQRLVPASSSFFISRQIPTPATFGFFQPAILFPARFLDMEPAMQKAIALHELLHVERRDWLWNMFEEIVLTLLWFHLPLWWVVRSARLSREQVVDAEAVRRSNARRPYLKALLEMAGQKRLAESLPAPLFLRENQLAERVALMMREVHMSRTRLTFSILTTAVTLLIAGASLVWAFPLKTAAPQAETSAASSEPAQNGAGTYRYQGKDYRALRALGKVYKVGGDVHAPEPVNNPDPPYTPQARKNHLTGTVIFTVVVDAKGGVAEVKQLSKPLGQGLDESAIRTIRSWKFKPGTRNGVPVPVRVQAEITFRLYGKAGDASPKANPITDPLPQGNQNASTKANNNYNVHINQAEIQRQLDEAMKQAEIAQQASSRVDQEKIQQQIEKAMKQANIAQKNFAKVDQAKIQRQVEAAMKQLQKVDTPEMRRKYEEARKQFQKMNTPEMQRGYEEALKQLKMAQMTAPKIDQAKIQQQVEQAMEQAKLAQESAAKVNKAEIQRQLDEMRKQMEQARQEAQAAREEARKARQDVMEARRDTKEQRKAAKPVPSATPKPSPAPPKEITPPPAPPAPPAPPKTPESAAIVGGVRGGVVGGVPGGKIGGVQGGQVIGVLGGITDGVITAPHPPVAPSPSPKDALPPPAPASPSPPPTPQN